MPTLEDTVDFKVATLNDLLDADVRTGVPVTADDKYKRWAFVSTGLAGMLLIALIVALVTGGGDDGGGTTASKPVDAPPNTKPVDVPVGSTIPSGVEPGASVIVLDQTGTPVAGATVTRINEAAGVGKIKRYTVVIAIPDNDLRVVNAAKAAGDISLQAGTFEATTTTTAPAPGTAPTPIEPAPATTPSS